MVDILIKNAELVDGSGQLRKTSDIAIQGDKIIDIGDLGEISAKSVVDAKGKVVSPGFIDMHSHEDMLITVAPEAESLVCQGITTVVTGQCGMSPVPLMEETREEAIKNLGMSDVPIPWEELSSFGSFIDLMEKTGMSVNLHALVGQGAIRSAVMGYSADRPSEEQIEKMQDLVRQAMEEGAAGITTGLIYPPGSYASTEELIEITKPVGEKGGIYFSHLRGEGDTLLEATREAIEIGRKTGSAVQHSHFKAAGRDNWGLADKALNLIEKARAEGMDVTADMYPYTAGGTSLVAILPEWTQEGGLDDIAKRLSDNETRLRITDSMKTEGFFKVAEWDKVLIPDSENPEHVGKYISELAEKSGKTPYNWIYDAILETNGNISMILFMMSEENIKKQLVYPFMMIGTDGVGMPFEGPYAKGKPHPRNFGTYPRVLGKYVREEKAITLEDAIWKSTGLPAKKLGFSDRGLIRPGYKADLVIFDPNTIIDKSEFIDPFQRPEGIEKVFVNGQIVVENGLHTQVRSGVVTSR
ncbi:MAG: D-aminoacylase [Anaerolineaceae bacterium]|nr:D-aminoacylase [Anaerolineaceae bacterium]